MKSDDVNKASRPDSIQLNRPAAKKGMETSARDASSEATLVGSAYLGEEKVSLERTKEIREALDPETLKAERTKRFLEIQQLVQSGRYFEENPTTDIAQGVIGGVGEEIDILKSIFREREEDEESGN